MDADYNQSSQIFTEPPPLAYAGFWERFFAMLIDGIIIEVINYLVGLAFGFSYFEGGTDRYRSINSFFYSSFRGDSIVDLIVSWLYYALQESGPAQATLGKRALGMQVVGQSGQRISFINATGRHFGKIVSVLILFIGYLMVIWDDRKQALHDKMAGTFVVKR